MGKKPVGILVLMVLLWAVTAQAQVSEELVKMAKAEGRAEFYANMTAIEPALEAFKKKYGIEVRYTRLSTPKFAPTVLTEFEARRIRASVLQAPVPVLEALKNAGVLAPYTSPVAKKMYPGWSMDPDGMIQLFGIEYVSLIYNKKLVAPAAVPTSYRDLTDPKWRGRIVMPDPTTHTTTIQWLVGLKEHNLFPSEAAWREFLKGLAANRPMLVSSLGPTPGPISTGEVHIGISMPKYIVTLAPAPLDWARVREPLFGTPRALAMAKGAPHPNAAKLFIDYWLDKEAQRILADKVGEWVLHQGVYPPIEGIDKAKVLSLRTMSDEEVERWGKQFESIFK
jgi:iron(III) transport system substrate-binding protein